MWRAWTQARVQHGSLYSRLGLVAAPRIQ